MKANLRISVKTISATRLLCALDQLHDSPNQPTTDSACKPKRAGSPAAWPDAPLPQLENLFEDAFNRAQIKVVNALESDTAFAAAHLAQAREVRLHDVSLADIKRHVVLLRGQGADL